MGRCLIVVDMLFDFIDPKGALFCGPTAAAIVPRVRALIDEFRSAGDAIVYLADSHDPDDAEFKRFGRHAVAGSPGARVIKALEPRVGDVVVAKRHFSGFYDTRLDEVIRGIAPGEAHLAGVCTSICVMETAGDLVDRGYPVVVHADAVADFDQEQHSCALKRMEKVLGVRLEPKGA